MYKSRVVFFIVSIFYLITLFYISLITPITPHEAKIFYSSNEVVGTLMRFGNDYFYMRFFSFVSGVATLFLFYFLIKEYFKKDDIFEVVYIFMLLPATITGIVVVNSSILIMPFILISIILYLKEKLVSISIPMFILAILDKSTILFFSILVLYFVIKKDKFLTILSLFFLLFSYILYGGIEIGGHPSGHFVHTIGLYTTIFSPLLFLYFFYAIYRTLLHKGKNIIWYISFFVFIFSLIISIRQKIDIASFAPFVVIGIIPMMELYYKSLKVRLPEFQNKYKIGYRVIIFFLLLNAILIVTHSYTYKIMQKKELHFSHRTYYPYYLAKELKKNNIECFNSEKYKYQLQFYGIKNCKATSKKSIAY